MPYSDASMRAQPYLDSQGNILNEAAYKRAVGKLGHHVIKNATWVLPHFNCLVQVRYQTMIWHAWSSIAMNVMGQ